MKKKITKLLLVTMLAGILAGCGTKTECDFCGEEKRCLTKTVWGEEVNYCKECEDELKDFFK